MGGYPIMREWTFKVSMSENVSEFKWDSLDEIRIIEKFPDFYQPSYWTNLVKLKFKYRKKGEFFGKTIGIIKFKAKTLAEYNKPINEFLNEYAAKNKLYIFSELQRPLI